MAAMGTGDNTFISAIRMKMAAATPVTPAASRSNIGTKPALARPLRTNNKVVGIASSTGGTDALEKILSRLNSDCPPILIVQHMPSGFTKLFADRLNGTYPMEIREAQTGDAVRPGLVLIAPANFHMTVVYRAGKLVTICQAGTRLHGVMPAADLLFDSMAEVLRAQCVGVVLTGMGTDGAKGLLRMRLAGAQTIAQDKETSVVYGMPKAAKDLGAVDFELPIQQIGEKIIALTM